jgi:hypothetical protein
VTRSGVVWITALLSLPFLGVLVGSSLLVNCTDDTWRWRNIAWVVLGLGLPLACAVVHRRVGAVVVTLLVGLTTYPAIRHLVSGPRVADTTIAAIGCQTRARRSIRCIEQRVTLGDGRAVVIDAARVSQLHPGDHARVMTLDDVALRVDRQ